MITLPTTPGLRSVTPVLVDPGLLQRPPTGAAITRVDRPGMHFAADVAYPPMTAATAMRFLVRLSQAKSAGLRLPWPLGGVSQGSPGSPTVNGSGVGGTSLPVTGATSGYQVAEGYWLNVIDGDGVRYLHQAAAAVTLTGGAGTISVWPPLRADLVNGDAVELAAPVIEGAVTSEVRWPLPHQKIVTIEFTLEESV